MTATLVWTSFFCGVVNCIPDQMVEVVFCLFVNPGGSLPDHFFGIPRGGNENINGRENNKELLILIV